MHDLTPNRKRGILLVKRRFPCRFCPAKFESFDLLRFHAQTEHQRAFHVINRDLAKTDAKLRSLQTVADEGMHGHAEAGIRKEWMPDYPSDIPNDIPDVIEEIAA